MQAYRSNSIKRKMDQNPWRRAYCFKPDYRTGFLVRMPHHVAIPPLGIRRSNRNTDASGLQGGGLLAILGADGSW